MAFEEISMGQPIRTAITFSDNTGEYGATAEFGGGGAMATPEGLDNFVQHVLDLLARTPTIGNVTAVRQFQASQEITPTPES